MDNKNIFAFNLRQQMKNHRKTRRDICNDLGFSYYTFSDWVNGKKYPRMDKVEILASYFGILKSDLIEDKQAQEDEKKGQPAEAELSENKSKLIDFVLKVPEDKVELVLRVMKSIVEDD